MSKVSKKPEDWVFTVLKQYGEVYVWLSLNDGCWEYDQSDCLDLTTELCESGVLDVSCELSYTSSLSVSETKEFFLDAGFIADKEFAKMIKENT